MALHCPVYQQDNRATLYKIHDRFHAPQSDIVYDYFHVTKYLNEAVDKVRKKEHRELRRKKDKSWSRTKYMWLKNPENRTAKDENRYAGLSKSQLAVGHT